VFDGLQSTQRAAICQATSASKHGSSAGDPTGVEPWGAFIPEMHPQGCPRRLL